MLSSSLRGGVEGGLFYKAKNNTTQWRNDCAILQEKYSYLTTGGGFNKVVVGKCLLEVPAVVPFLQLHYSCLTKEQLSNALLAKKDLLHTDLIFLGAALQAEQAVRTFFLNLLKAGEPGSATASNSLANTVRRLA